MADTPAGWFPDPSGRHELRYWDGAAWTDHVSTGGQTGTETLGTAGTPTPPTPPSGGRALLSEPILVVNQKIKLIELTNEYAVYDQNGSQIGSVRQVGQSAARKVLRALTSVDQFLTTRLQVCAMDGTVVLELTRPPKVFKSTVVVANPGGGEVGRIVQQNMVGKINFGLEAGGQQIGTIKAENWRAWNFRIEDATGTEVARITKTWEGLAKTMFTTADNYVVQIHRPLDEPLRSLVVASALCVDTALKQDDRSVI